MAARDLVDVVLRRANRRLLSRKFSEGCFFVSRQEPLFFLSSDLESLIQRISERLIDAASGGLKRRGMGRLRQSKSLDFPGSECRTLSYWAPI